MADELTAVAWTGDALRLTDQTALPHRVVHLEIRDVDALVAAITRLAVRGAPALGVTGAYGVAVAALQADREGWTKERLAAEIDRIRRARPTAVNLAAGVDRVLPRLPGGVTAVLAAADELARENLAANHAIGRRGADWILARTSHRPLRILTHCHTGALATAGWGTALGVVRELHGRGQVGLVYADETRPLLQGARLTAWELGRLGIPHYVQADAAAAGTVLRGLVDVAVVGADRIAVNGDTANKIGTVGVALACAAAGVPFVVAAPTTTLDRTAATGADIPIELRAGDEVLTWGGVRTGPADSPGFNPAFDITPARLISALVFESGITEPADDDQTPPS